MVNAYCDGIQRVIKEQEDAAANEMWVEEKQDADYIEELEKADQLWLKKEARRNKRALETMRRLVPVNLVHCNPDGTHMTEKRLLTSRRCCCCRNTNSGHIPIMTLELAAELYSNRLLHWIVTHKDDIARQIF